MKYVALEGKFDVVAGPSTRRLIDFSDVAHSFGINPLGNSGHLLSKHEKDQAQMFLQGEYRPQWMNLDDINKNAESEQLFEP
jgi:penicillin amidase